MNRYAIINKENKVVNVIIWDGKSNWQPPKDHYVIKEENCDIGDSYDLEKKCMIHADRSEK